MLRRKKSMVWFCACVLAGCMLIVALLSSLELAHGSVNGTELRMKARRKLLRNACATYKQKTYNTSLPTDTRSRMLYSAKLGATMCYVPKAGCTFWKRIFLIDQLGVLSNAFQLSHLGVHSRSKMLSALSFDQSYYVLSKYIRVLFTREPFSRLFSVYVDKFYLSNFWMYGGTIIRSHRTNPDAKAVKCGSDVSLNEFLKYVIESNHNPPYENAKEHWISVTNLCLPCTFDYDVIGHQETFDEDREYILQKLGIENQLGVPLKLPQIFIDAIRLLVQKHWSSIQFGKIPCITSEDYLRRIWTALKYQGYLPYDAAFPRRFLGGGLMANLNQNTTISFIYRATGVDDLSISGWNARKVQAMSNFYENVELEVKERISKLFKYDSILFGYDRKPDYVFQTQSSHWA